MPNKMIYALSKKHKIPVDELEEKWDAAKKIVVKQYGSTTGKFGILMTIFRRMTNIGESKITFSQLYHGSKGRDIPYDHQ